MFPIKSFLEIIKQNAGVRHVRISFNYYYNNNNSCINNINVVYINYYPSNVILGYGIYIYYNMYYYYRNFTIQTNLIHYLYIILMGFLYKLLNIYIKSLINIVHLTGAMVLYL